MRMRTLLGVAAGLLLSVACASKTPLAPNAIRSTAVTPASQTVPSADPSVTTDNRAEQIVFSGQTPEGTFTNTGSVDVQDVGFWVWCEHKKADNSYAGDCNGSLNIGDLSHGVSGTVTMDGDMDQHIISVSSTDGSLACTLMDHDPVTDESSGDSNDVPHTPGPTNTVSVSCTAPAGVSGTFYGAVVKTTERPGT